MRARTCVPGRLTRTLISWNLPSCGACDRVVAEQVVGARVDDNLLHRSRQIVAIDDGAAVGLIREHAQRVLRLTQRLVAAPQADVLVDVELAGRQPARIHGVERGVAAVGGGEDVLHLALQVHLPGHVGAVLGDAVLASGGIPAIGVAQRPASAATGSRNCGGSTAV